MESIMETKPKTTSTQFPYDMSGWCAEKSEMVTEELALLIDDLRKDDNIEKDIKEKIWGFVYPALYNSTKLLSFFCGAEWSTGDREIIFDKGYKGYEELSVKYGLIEETTESKEKKEIERFIRRFRTYLDGSRYPNRTFIHDLLQSKKLKHPIINDLSDITEKVTLGEIDWENYAREALLLLDRLSKIYLDNI